MSTKNVRFVAGAETGIFFDVLDSEEFEVNTFKDEFSDEAVVEQIRIGRAMADFLTRTANAIVAELDQVEADLNDR